jgi:hypothetical protein
MAPGAQKERPMFAGVALALSELPRALLEAHGLGRRVHERGGEREVQFLLRDAAPLLPVWYGGQLEVLRWGNRRGESRALPCTNWTWLATVEAGGWAGCEAEEIVIPATLGLDGGIWFRIREGVRGVLVHDEEGRPRVYVLCEPASHYYRIMTRSDWMPCLVGQHI